MRIVNTFSGCLAGTVLFAGSLVAVAADRERHDDSKRPSSRNEFPAMDLLEAARSGGVGVEAEGIGDGRMTVRVTNQTNRKLRVLLPPGLVASGATGQFGGMGGMGGGMMGGGMGGMGGGMGGMGGGMGGMGGGMMGGMGGGMGGRGGMMGGRGMLTMPPTMGLMMLGRMIMTLVEPTDSWDYSSLMQGMSMMGGMGRGMGGMGMGGMGMGMGGKGGGFRSVPPTGLPGAVIKPGQTRSLATRLVSLNAPVGTSVAMPAAGERLRLGDIGQITNDPRVRKALRRLAEEKAPAVVSQLVLWNVAYKLDWAAIVARSGRWANEDELALARKFAEQLDALPEGESGRLFLAFDAKEEGHEATAKALDDLFRDRMTLGLGVALGVPEMPEGPAVGVKVSLVGEPAKPEALVRVAESRGPGEWASMGKFSLPLEMTAEGKPDLEVFGDALAAGVMTRLVRASLVRTKTQAGDTALQVRIENASPMVLNALSVIPAEHKPTDAPKTLVGIALPPGRSLALKVSEGTAQANHLKGGLKLVALDLSAL